MRMQIESAAGNPGLVVGGWAWRVIMPGGNRAGKNVSRLESTYGFAMLMRGIAIGQQASLSICYHSP